VHGHIVARQRLNRRQFARVLAQQPAIHVVMEACGTAHYWAAWRSNTDTR
jgi:transposase